MLSIIICIIALIILVIIHLKYKENPNICLLTFIGVQCMIVLDYIIGTIAPVEYTHTKKLYYEDIIVSSDKIVYADTENYICEIVFGNLDTIKLQEDTENYIEVKHYEHNPKWLALTGTYQEYIVHGNVELKEGIKWELERP